MDLLSNDSAFAIALRLDLDLLCTVLLLDVLVCHDVVQFLLNLDTSGVFKYGSYTSLHMVNKEQFTFTLARVSTLEEHRDIALNSL